MSYKSLTDYCRRADLVDSSWVLAETSKLNALLTVAEDMRDKADVKVKALEEALAQIALVAGSSNDDYIQTLALKALGKL
jgi:hypothetical protein